MEVPLTIFGSLTYSGTGRRACWRGGRSPRWSCTWQWRRGTQPSFPPTLLLQLALIFTLPYISTLTSVLGLVSVEKLLHAGLGCELIAHPCREHCRYSEDLCAQGRYCGASQGVNLLRCGTSSPTHAAGAAQGLRGPPGPRWALHTQCPHAVVAHVLLNQEKPGRMC